jgi:D-cysteine desulfhydrase
VRKLEFILAEAQQRGVRTIITFGRAGTNHGVATAVFATPLNIHTICLVLPQPNTAAVRQNLLFMLANGAELHQFPNRARLVAGAVWQVGKRTAVDRRRPLILEAGGSTPLGTLGYVNAAFELRQQIAAGLCPEPDLIYVAAGTLGTAVGLILGCHLARLKSQVIPVRVVETQYASPRLMARLFHKTYRVIHSFAPVIHNFHSFAEKLDVREGFYGDGYGVYTQAGETAVHQMQQLEGIPLEGTYTGKTLAALIADARSGQLTGKTVLFWNSYNSHNFASQIAHTNYRHLPPAFHPYFERQKWVAD